MKIPSNWTTWLTIAIAVIIIAFIINRYLKFLKAKKIIQQSGTLLSNAQQQAEITGQPLTKVIDEMAMQTAMRAPLN
jgi:hypothetical protein